jgi:hypothetical protein
MDNGLCVHINTCLVSKFNWLDDNKKQLERLFYLAKIKHNYKVNIILDTN